MEINIKITALYAGILGLLYFGLLLLVVRKRHKAGIAFGDGADMILQSRIRAHANFNEYIPTLLILMLLIEINQYEAYILHIIGSAIILSRLLHIYGLLIGEHKEVKSYKGRFYGTLLTCCILIMSSLLNISAFVCQ